MRKSVTVLKTISKEIVKGDTLIEDGDFFVKDGSVRGNVEHEIKEFMRKPRKEKTNWTRLLNESMPLPDQIKNFEVMGNSIYFEWRRNEYKIETKTCSVWLVKGGMLNGDDCSTLIEHILKGKLK